MADIRDTPEESYAERTVRTVLMGDFYENPTIAGIAIRAAVTTIPGVDTVADLQDTGAWVLLCRDKGLDDLVVKINGLLLGIGWIPAAGSVAKAVLRVLDTGSGAHAVVEMLKHVNWFGQGNGVDWLVSFSSELPSLAQKAAGLMGKVTDEMTNLLHQLVPHVSAGPQAKIQEWLVAVGAIRTGVGGMFREAASHLKQKLDDALQSFKKEEFDVPAPTRSEAARVQDSAPPQTGNPFNMKRQSDSLPGNRDSKGTLYRGDTRTPEELKAAGGFHHWADTDTSLAEHIINPSQNTPWISTTKSEGIARWYAAADGREGAIYRLVQPGGVDLERVGIRSLNDPLIDGLQTAQVAFTDSIPWQNIHSYATPSGDSALQWTRNADYNGPEVPGW